MSDRLPKEVVRALEQRYPGCVIELLANRNEAFHLKLFMGEKSEFVFAKVATTESAGIRLKHERDVYKLLADLPCVIQPIDHWSRQGLTVLVLPYSDKPTLAEHIKEVGISPQSCGRLLVALLSCVDHLHRRKIAHRDLKPENIFISVSTGQFDVHLFDFEYAAIGFSQFVDTPADSIYQLPVSQRLSGGSMSDVYSLGVMAYQMVHGLVPDASIIFSPEEVSDGILFGAISPASDMGYCDAGEFLAAVQAVPDWPHTITPVTMGEEGITVPLGGSSSASVRAVGDRKAMAQHNWLAWMMGGVLVFALVTFVVMTGRMLPSRVEEISKTEPTTVKEAVVAPISKEQRGVEIQSQGGADSAERSPGAALSAYAERRSEQKARASVERSAISTLANRKTKKSQTQKKLTNRSSQPILSTQAQAQTSTVNQSGTGGFQIINKKSINLK